MTVKDLIKKLKEYDDDTIVTVCEYNGSDDLYREIKFIKRMRHTDASDKLKKRLKNHTPGAIYLSALERG
jgi:hypothetical protein